MIISKLQPLLTPSKSLISQLLTVTPSPQPHSPRSELQLAYHSQQHQPHHHLQQHQHHPRLKVHRSSKSVLPPRPLQTKPLPAPISSPSNLNQSESKEEEEEETEEQDDDDDHHYHHHNEFQKSQKKENKAENRDLTRLGLSPPQLLATTSSPAVVDTGALGDSDHGGADDGDSEHQEDEEWIDIEVSGMC